MEKSLNRGELKGFKNQDESPNAMIPGIISESPLRIYKQREAVRRPNPYEADSQLLG